MPKIVPKSIQTCFERVLGQTFRKFFAQFSTAFRILENFQKNQKKISKFQKRPKSFPKESKRDLIVIWDNFFEKFLPSFPWKVESSKIVKKLKKVSSFLKRPKSFPKVSKRVLNKFWGKLFEIFFCPVFRGMSSLRKFSKKYFQNSKIAQKCSQKYPNVL